ncbi:hypothetical protein BJX65DRAFT_286132 [Aspergillus insuetus]
MALTVPARRLTLMRDFSMSSTPPDWMSTAAILTTTLAPRMVTHVSEQPPTAHPLETTSNAPATPRPRKTPMALMWTRKSPAGSCPHTAMPQGTPWCS